MLLANDALCSNLYFYREMIRKKKIRRLSNKLNKTIASAKKGYYAKILDKNKHNVKKTWQILQSVLPTNFLQKLEQKDPILFSSVTLEKS